MQDNGFSWLVDGALTIDQPALFGFKFTRQVALAQAGFTVPPLVCVPATVFDHVVGPEVAASGHPEVEPAERAERLRRRVQALAVPAELLRELDERFAEIAGPDGMVAVR